jgi:hypothetical protein
MQYVIWIVSPYVHSECFREVAQSLQFSLIELGHNAEITTKPPLQRQNVIILGAHLLHPNDLSYLKTPIVWQLEQMPDESDEERARAPWTATYLEILKRAEVWDYSQTNIKTLKTRGINAKLLEVGYTPNLTRIENSSEPTIDVLHIGSLNERRVKILEQLRDNGVKVAHAFDCYGVKRDMLVAKAKIVINVHFFAAKLFEIVRCSYMLANRKCIVSENGLDIGLEYPYIDCIPFCEYGELVDTCLEYLQDDYKRTECERWGLRLMQSRSQIEFLKAVL